MIRKLGGIEALHGLLDTPSERIRQQASRALQNLGAPVCCVRRRSWEPLTCYDACMGGAGEPVVLSE
jgi:Armadillo/beta-catenin-like repeat